MVLLVTGSLAAEAQAGPAFFDLLEGTRLKGGLAPTVVSEALRQEGAGLIALFERGRLATLVQNGSPSSRVNLVLVGDGYTAAEQGQFRTEAKRIADGLFEDPALGEYASYFNIYSVEMDSPDSGVSGDPDPATKKSTPLGMSFGCHGMARLLCVSPLRAIWAARVAPKSDLVVAVANSGNYGGAAFIQDHVLTVAGGQSVSGDLARHEFGHVFAGLADEYEVGGPQVYQGSEPSGANSSKLDRDAMLARQSKWFRWLDEPGVGAFEGSSYSPQGVFRPTEESLMRELGRPFGPVNGEQIILNLYQRVGGPVEAASPQGTYPAGVALQVVPLRPAHHAITLEWYVDGVYQRNQTSEVLDTSKLHLGPGDHQISFRGVDLTPAVRDEKARKLWMTRELFWVIAKAK